MSGTWPVRVVALAIGLVAVAVGVGIGPRHYAVSGLGAAAVVGVALLLTGLGIGAWATFGILAAVRRRWWALVIPVVLVATYLVVWTLGQAVAASFAPRPALGEGTPAELGLAYDDVTFRSSDDQVLAGWYLPTRNGAAVALLHGAGSTRTSVLPHASVLAEHGYGVLLFDARGHGESDGRSMDFGWYGESDVIGAIDFLTRQDGVAPGRIGLVGISMGGEEAIGAAGLDERVTAVVAEGATSRVAADKGYLDTYGTRGQVQQGIDHVTFWLAGLLSGAAEPASLQQSVSAASTRSDPATFLLITAGSVPDEALAAAHMRGSHTDRVQVWTVPGAGHARGLGTSPAEWQRRVVGFLDDTLVGRP